MRYGSSELSGDLLRECLVDELSAVFREAVVPAFEVKGEPHVIQAHKPQDGRVQITHMIRGFDGAIAKWIGRTHRGARLDARSGEPDSLCSGIVIPSGAAL